MAYLYRFFLMFIALIYLGSCTDREDAMEATRIERERLEKERAEEEAEIERKRPRTANDINLRKDFAYDQYTLEDTYEYQGTERIFQWDKMREVLARIETLQLQEIRYAVVQNYKNKNGEAPVVKNFVRNAYSRVSDTLGTERYQSAPLYQVDARDRPTIYGRDGSLVELLSADTLDYLTIKGISFDGTWEIPRQYIKVLSDHGGFHRVAVVDVSNQNIATLERKEDDWIILSMNPATTGVHDPPYAHETPSGLYVIQEKKEKMYFLKDGTRDEIAGFAPHASRFTRGGYIHGVPVNYPQKSIIEYSNTLGTIPRSHMCVRNASSHAQFVYDWAPTWESLVLVID